MSLSLPHTSWNLLPRNGTDSRSGTTSENRPQVETTQGEERSVPGTDVQRDWHSHRQDRNGQGQCISEYPVETVRVLRNIFIRIFQTDLRLASSCAKPSANSWNEFHIETFAIGYTTSRTRLRSSAFALQSVTTQISFSGDFNFHECNDRLKRNPHVWRTARQTKYNIKPRHNGYTPNGTVVPVTMCVFASAV